MTYEAFYQNEIIQTIILPESIEEIRKNIFVECPNLRKVICKNPDIKIDPEATRYCGSFTGFFDEDGNLLYPGSFYLT